MARSMLVVLALLPSTEGFTVSPAVARVRASPSVKFWIALFRPAVLYFSRVLAPSCSISCFLGLCPFCLSVLPVLLSFNLSVCLSFCLSICFSLSLPLDLFLFLDRLFSRFFSLSLADPSAGRHPSPRFTLPSLPYNCAYARHGAMPHLT